MGGGGSWDDYREDDNVLYGHVWSRRPEPITPNINIAFNYLVDLVLLERAILLSPLHVVKIICIYRHK